ncbi:outer membrane protein assembly factor BamA [Aliarcobacter trophiarum LMG 25534]|uniref:Outer membrane protein assembly factor BamA n=1 Tax=Aliarcobacter trophiarum LMG 25534 TaxID=1032241 RepID=A0AAD0QKZ2_9BACT|nr:outer membrane protein assembly factor BamA [Aliarcobacter trophiarum]AXK48755.1 beta-barrel assembly machinery complex, BamA/YaeT protein [Aliarcobacter trophiarum LMG 25534]RXI25070.1 outer membrane protein assembly factor BamA [Aliarcobacter trophiarum]RXJ92078.1 outer membrane protein assembly factor BamA [Aliarcobacter trophiarum LMG 25534]
MKNRITLLSLACATVLSANSIKSIEYVNVSKVSPQVLEETLGMRAGETLDENKLNEALIKFYSYGYFDDIVVDNDNGNLKILFKEKPSIANVDIKGYKTRSEDNDAIKKVLKLNKGSMYSEKRVKEAKEQLLGMLSSDGFINSVVEVETEKLSDSSVKLTFNVNKGDEIIIREARYHGANELDGSDFKKVTANKEKEFASWWFGQSDGEMKIDQLKYDARRINDLYFEKGYLDADIKEPFLDIDFASNQAKIDFFVKEGEKYTTNDIKIYLDSSIVDPEEIYSELKLKVDRTFNIKKLRDDQEYIRTLVADKGYAYAEVKFDLKKNEAEHRVDVVFSVVPGEQVYINDVKISGNARTLDRVVRRDVYLAPGDMYNLTDIKDAKNKLKRSSFFEDVQIEEKRISEDKMDISVKVTEAPTGSIMLGGGYGSYDKLMINGSVSDTNIFGSGLTLSLSGDLSKRSNRYEVALKNPSINDSDYNGDIEAHSTKIEYRRSQYDSDVKTKGFSIGAGKEIIRNTYVGARYGLDFVKETYEYDSDFLRKPIPAGKKLFEDTDYTNSSITPYINYDSTNDFYFPTDGIKAGASVEYAGVGGDSKYIKPGVNFRYFYSLEDLTELDWVLRFKTQAKMLIDNGQINQGDSLYLGGPKTLRGYKSYAFPNNDSGYYQDPYEKMWSNQFEVSFPLVPSAKMRWGLFYDYGMIGKSSFSEVKRSGTGALLEWISPMGPLQLIFAKPIGDKPGDDTSSFEFSFGTSF